MAGRCGIYWMRWVRRVTQRWCMVYAQISAEPCWLLNVSMAAASSKETAEASEPKDWCRDLYQRILTILTLFNNHGKSHGRWVRSSQKMFLIPTAIMVHRCPSSMWYLCIHCAGRVIDILMQPEYRKCWRPTWLAKLWVFNTMPVQSLATHERRNEHYTAGMFFWECKGLLWILISPFILHLPRKVPVFSWTCLPQPFRSQGAFPRWSGKWISQSCRERAWVSKVYPKLRSYTSAPEKLRQNRIFHISLVNSKHNLVTR